MCVIDPTDISPLPIVICAPLCVGRYQRLRSSIERELSVPIFPHIDVEEKMENKEIYMQYLAEHIRPYRPFNWPIDRIASAVPLTLPQPSVVCGPVDAPYALHLSPHNSTLAPTVLLCVARWSKLTVPRRVEVLQWAIDALRAESHTAFPSWPHTKSTDQRGRQCREYFLKGHNSSRSNACERYAINDDNADLTVMRKDCDNWHKRGGASQPRELVSEHNQRVVRSSV